MVACSAINCRVRSDCKNRFFRFPRDPVRRKQWADNCHRGGDWKPSINSRLCERHFDENQFERHRLDGWKKLKMTAVPTLFDFFDPHAKTERKPISTVLNGIKSKPIQEKVSVTNISYEIISVLPPPSVTDEENSAALLSENSNLSEDESVGDSSNQSALNSISPYVNDHDYVPDKVTFTPVNLKMFEPISLENTSNQVTYSRSTNFNAENLKKEIVSLPFLTNFDFKDTYAFEEVKPLLLKLKDLYEENQILRNENSTLLSSFENVDS